MIIGRDFLRRLRFVVIRLFCVSVDGGLRGGSSIFISTSYDLGGELGVDGVLNDTSTISDGGSLSRGLGGRGKDE